MANIVKHRFTSAKTNGPDATQIQPSHWNDGHAFTGGNNADALTRDTSDATWGAKWAPMGQKKLIAFNAANFSGNGAMTWTVSSGNIQQNAYSLIGNTMTWAFFADGTIGGTAANYLLITLPDGLQTSGHCPNRVSRCVVGAAVLEAEIIVFDATHIGIRRIDLTNYPLGAMSIGFTASMFIA